MSAALAAAVVAARSSPETKDTLLEASLSVNARSGELGNQTWRREKFAIGDAPGCGAGGGTTDPPGASTCADPPPVSTPTSAWPPIKTTECRFEPSRGKTPCSFFS